MTLLRALLALLALTAALDGQQNCRAEGLYDQVECDGDQQSVCIHRAYAAFDATGLECCEGWERDQQCGFTNVSGSRLYPTTCSVGCRKVPLSVSVGASSVALRLDQAWGTYSGTTALTWAGGSGASVTLTVAEFSPTSGPTLSGGDLRARTTAGLSSWTALAASTNYTVVPTLSTPGTETVSWAVRDLPSYSTGTYSATATFTISEP